MVDEYLNENNIPQDSFLTGYYKDVLLPNDPDKLHIYGGYRNGELIQRGPSPHAASYVDYSSGTRIIGREVTIITAGGNPKTMDIRDFMANEEMAKKFGFTPVPKDRNYDNY